MEAIEGDEYRLADESVWLLRVDFIAYPKYETETMAHIRHLSGLTAINSISTAIRLAVYQA